MKKEIPPCQLKIDAGYNGKLMQSKLFKRRCDGESGVLAWRINKHLITKKPIEDFKIITIVRDPIDQLVSYYWWAHTNPTMGAFCPDACPVNGDTRKDIYRKFVLWLNKPYRAAIFKDWTSAPIETPVETLVRINEAMVAEADTVLLHSDLQNECKEKLGIKFLLPKMKSGKKVIADKASDYFFNNKKLLNDILASFPISMKYLKNDS